MSCFRFGLLSSDFIDSQIDKFRDRQRGRIWKRGVRYSEAGTRVNGGWNIFHVLSFMAIVLGLAFSAGRVEAESREALWDALRSGDHLALLRHAVAPGIGDPAEFKIGDCSTQRNLSQQGRIQAKEIGEEFRANGIPVARVYSSQWCRCLDTATLLQLGTVQELPSLNSFFRKTENREPQTQELMAWTAMQDLDDVTVLVTHQVNITALTGVYPGSGELVIVKFSNDDGLKVIGTIKTE